MRILSFIAVAAAILTTAAAQTRILPPAPYKPVVLALPQPVTDEGRPGETGCRARFLLAA
jgi:hypothetical protein